MARLVNRLTAASVKRLGIGRHADGLGLYLFVRAESRSWVFRWRDRGHGRLRDAGLGSVVDISLARARELAREYRDAVLAGRDPVADKRQRRIEGRLAVANLVTFAEVSKTYVAAHAAGWRNAKHKEQWTNSLATHAADLGPMPVADIETSHVVRALEKIWTVRTETASRVRQRIEAVLAFATVRGYRSGDNPARWRNHLDKLLPAPAKVKKVEHRPAVAVADMPKFVRELRTREGFAARALEFQALTATRPSETLGARWEEIDLATKVWTIPATRMKAGRPHRVPLPREAVALLKALQRIEKSPYLFPSGRGGHLSLASPLKVMRELRPGKVPHGLRSSFRQWAAEKSEHSREAAELALAHVLKDKTEAAYQRADLLEKRRSLMADWARYCASAS